jgi:hypothetical protein
MKILDLLLIVAVSSILAASCQKQASVVETPTAKVVKQTRGSRGIANRTYTGIAIQPYASQTFDVWIGSTAEYVAGTTSGEILAYDGNGNFLGYVTNAEMCEDVNDHILTTADAVYYPSSDLTKSVTYVSGGMAQVAIEYEKKVRGSRGIAN